MFSKKTTPIVLESEEFGICLSNRGVLAHPSVERLLCGDGSDIYKVILLFTIEIYKYFRKLIEVAARVGDVESSINFRTPHIHSFLGKFLDEEFFLILLIPSEKLVPNEETKIHISVEHEELGTLIEGTYTLGEIVENWRC